MYSFGKYSTDYCGIKLITISNRTVCIRLLLLLPGCRMIIIREEKSKMMKGL